MREFEPGFGVTEMQVMLPGGEVDRILLNRIDPKRFRFVVRSATEGDKGLDEWERVAQCGADREWQLFGPERQT